MAEPEPAIIHPALGAFTPTPRLNGFYDGTAPWSDATIDVLLDARKNDGMAVADKLAALVARSAAIENEMQAELVRDLYPIWQTAWCECPKDDPGPQGWLARQKPHAIAFAGDSFDFYRTDDGLFLGHEIQLRWREGKGYFDAGIAG